MVDCKYRLPCGRCDKYDRCCDAPKECKHNWKFVQEYWHSEEHKFFNKYVCTECGDTEYRVNCFQPQAKIDCENCEHEWRYEGQLGNRHHYECIKCNTLKAVPLENLYTKTT